MVKACYKCLRYSWRRIAGYKCHRHSRQSKRLLRREWMKSPNIVIAALGGQKVGTPHPPLRLRSISIHLQSTAADAQWTVHTIQYSIRRVHLFYSTALWVSVRDCECSGAPPHPPSMLNMGTQWICVYSAVISILLWLTGENTNNTMHGHTFEHGQVCICVQSSVIPIFLLVD